jgi:hypothetical protein
MAEQMSQELFEEWLESEVSAQIKAIRSQLTVPAPEALSA